MRYLIPNRRAFTLTEMLVAAALTLFVMGLIATAYRAGLDTYTKLRVATGLSERLRTASDVIRNDLAQEHFGGPFVPGFSGPRLSDQRLDRLGWVPPRQGYFMVYQGQNSTLEGVDNDGLSHTYADGTAKHILAFTSRRPAGPPESLYCAKAPTAIANHSINPFLSPDRFYSRWAEITYFLEPNGDTIQPGNTPLYSLRRRERLLAPGPDVTFTMPTNANEVVAQFPNLALIPTSPINPTQVTLIGSESIARRDRRFTNISVNSPLPEVRFFGTQTSPLDTGDDILIPDVISFEVKLTWLNDSTTWSSVYSPPLSEIFIPGLQTDYPFSILPQTTLNTSLAGQRIFDTYYRASVLELGGLLYGNEELDWENRNQMIIPSNKLPPVRINVRGVQIKLRVWDYKAKMARQLTLIVDQ